MDPTEAEVERAVAALVPFVHRWRLPLNPEDLYEMAFAVLRHSTSDGDLASIDREVSEQINNHERAAAAMNEAWSRSIQSKAARPPIDETDT